MGSHELPWALVSSHELCAARRRGRSFHCALLHRAIPSPPLSARRPPRRVDRVHAGAPSTKAPGARSPSACRAGRRPSASSTRTRRGSDSDRVPRTFHGLPRPSKDLPQTCHGLPLAFHGHPWLSTDLPRTSTDLPRTFHRSATNLPPTCHGLRYRSTPIARRSMCAASTATRRCAASTSATSLRSAGASPP